jgi:hypothetical protein
MMGLDGRTVVSGSIKRWLNDQKFGAHNIISIPPGQ